MFSLLTLASCANASPQRILLLLASLDQQMSSSPPVSSVLPVAMEVVVPAEASQIDRHFTAIQNETTSPAFDTDRITSATDRAHMESNASSLPPPPPAISVAVHELKLSTGELIDAKNTAGSVDLLPLTCVTRAGTADNGAFPSATPGVSIAAVTPSSVLSTMISSNDPEIGMHQTPSFFNDTPSTISPSIEDSVVETQNAYIAQEHEQSTAVAVLIQEAQSIDETTSAPPQPWWKRRLVWLRVCGSTFLLAAVAIGGFCSSGNCTVRRKSFPKPADAQTPTISERARSLTDFINLITLSNDTLVVPTSDVLASNSTLSAEHRALAWLIFKDALQLWPDTAAHQSQLQQRYALLTLLVQYPAFLESSTAAISDSECDWLYVSCNASTGTQQQPSQALVTAVETDLITKTALGSTLSPDLGLLSSLEKFIVSENGLVGSLPSSFGSLWTNLKYFVADDNMLTGTIPSLLGTSWTNFEVLSAPGNALTGSLPSSFGMAWSNLWWLALFENALTGSLPSTLGTFWNNLTYFDVQINELTGSIPSSVSNWNSIQWAYFDHNDFVGSLPIGLCDNSTGSLTALAAGCEKVTCDCCTFCCNNVTGCCDVITGECFAY